MTSTHACESCGMPIETGRYCGYCTDSSGALQSFDERFERMVGWQTRRHPGATRQEIERPDPGLHGHHAGLAGSPAGHGQDVLAGVLTGPLSSRTATAAIAASGMLTAARCRMPALAAEVSAANAISTAAVAPAPASSHGRHGRQSHEAGSSGAPDRAGSRP